jgi:hypothetical protein
VNLRRIVAATLVAAGSVTGCPDNTGGPCDPACEAGFVCDETSATCVRPAITVWEGAAPGRGARVTIAGGRIVTASVDPETNSVVTGAGLRDETFDYRVLGQVGSTASRRVAIASAPSRVAVLWVAESGRFRIAWREASGRHERWSVTRVDPPVGVSYAPTEHFELDLEDDGSVRLVFRDRDGSLRTAAHDEALGVDGWTFETIDDGSPTAGGVTCPERDGPSSRGVGVDPDLVIREVGASVSYFDVDCGDLRLATQTNDGWNVVAVDVGDPLVAAAGGGNARVGRFSTQAWDTNGRPHIAYHDSSLGRLLVATTRGTGSWDVEVVDRGVTLDVESRERKDNVGSFATLTFDEQGASTVTYFDATITALRIARRAPNDSTWARRILADDGASGFFADHVYDATVGLVAVSEALVRDDGGLASRLRIVWEDAE